MPVNAAAFVNQSWVSASTLAVMRGNETAIIFSPVVPKCHIHIMWLSCSKSNLRVTLAHKEID